MRRLTLRSVLIALTLILVAAAVGAVAAVSYWQVRRAVREEAQARAEWAAAAAAEAVRETAGAATRAARVLAGRPTLSRLAAAGQRAELQSFLEQFRVASDLSACGALFQGEPVAAGPAAFLRFDAEAAGSYLLSADTGFVVGASDRAAARGAEPGPLVAAAIQLDPGWLAALGRRLGHRTRLLSPEEIAAGFAAPEAALWRQALAGESAARVLAGGLGVIAVQPLRSPAGEVLGAIEAQRPDAELVAPLRRFLARTAAAALVVCLLALAGSTVLARWLAAPVASLAAAARTLGGGDFAVPVPVAAGREVGALSTAMEDMRRRLLAAGRELERRRVELETVLGGIAEGVYAVDGERQVQYLNEQAAALLGVEREAAIGRFCGDLLRPATVGGVRPCEEDCPILHARARGSTIATERLIRGDGELLVLLSSAPPVGGMQVQILRAESPLEAARRARDAVVADLAHELKTPLAAQAASLELLRERLAEQAGRSAEAAEAADTSALAELVATAEAGTLRLRRLIDNLLESVRIESGQLGIRRVSLALDEVVEEAVEMTAPLFARRRQLLEVALAYPLPAVLGDPPRLAQVLINLLSNASKFAPEDSTVRIEAALAEGAVELSVADEGPGFAGDERAVRDDGAERRPVAARRFDRGFDRGAGGEPREEGSGLGLWIARSIVERHGGRLRVEREGARTRVAFSLPAEVGA